ncbi:MAG: anaerobic sulfatase maturase, partial [Planctomycetes bacterium]|nr:anaerobic sulfatase maturase [Planctomycetota bacterium]
MRSFSLLIKPSGSDCNIDCKYCFYKTRAPQIGQGKQRMNFEVLEKLVKDYMQLGFEVASFAWQGGEPTLMGLDFYKRLVEFQDRYKTNGQVVSNSLQTNSMALNPQWCKFLHDNNFLVGISIDGPKEMHDHYRKDLAGKGTYDRVIGAIDNCKEYGVEFNTLTLLNKINVEHPDVLIDFFIEKNIKFLQFIPCVELNPSTGEVADFSITPQQYGNFLCRIFDRWYEIGYENLSIRTFESLLSFCISRRHTICTFNKHCDGYIVVEHKGDCYPCDFFVQPELFLGNLMQTPIAEIAESKLKKDFNRSKAKFPNKCLLCRHLDICRGGCQKDRVFYEDEKRK